MAAEFDRHSESYEIAVERAVAFAGQAHDVYLEAKARKLLELARRRLGAEPVAALDVGCGIGLFERNPWNPLTRKVVRGCEFDHGVQLLPRREVTAALRAAGLDVTDAEYLLFSPWRGSLVEQMERALAKIPLGAQYVVAARAGT